MSADEQSRDLVSLIQERERLVAAIDGIAAALGVVAEDAPAMTAAEALRIAGDCVIEAHRLRGSRA